MEQTYNCAIKLIRYLLNGDVPELENFLDFEKLFEFGKSHGVENMLYVGLRNLNIAVPEDTMNKFKKEYQKSILLDVNQTFEYELLAEAFEQSGIDYLPLKGMVIKHLYPMTDYRKSGDIDILIRAEDEDKIKSIMENFGYIQKGNGTHEVHCSYVKKPYIEIEIHRKLTTRDDRAYKFCSKAWQYAILSEGKKHTYKMSNEYFYVHLMAHLCKHLYRGGVGIRHIIDFYIMNRELSLDGNLLKKYLRKTNLVALNDMIEKLTRRWFESEKVSDKDIDVLERLVFTSGSFGTDEMRKTMSASLTKSGNVERFISRLFPPVRILKNRYPILEKKTYLLFFYWVVRFFDVVLFERKTIRTKVSESFDDNNKDDDLQNIVKAIRDKGVKFK